MTNQELINKATITTDALAAAGKLKPHQADRFIDLVVDVTGLSRMARIERFRNEQLDIDKLNISKRAALPKAEATAPSVRRQVTASKVSLNPKAIVVPFEISSEFSFTNIEGEAVEDTILRMMATQLSNDVEEVLIDGDALGPARLESDLVDGGSTTQYVKDGYIALFDGWLKLAQAGNVVDASNANIGAPVFSSMLKAMPDKWKRVRRNMRFFVSSDHEQNYRATVSGRATAAGDVALSTTQNLTPFGVELVPLPLLSETPRVVKHLTLSGTTAVATGFTNISEVVVTKNTLGASPETAYVETTDYIVDYALGTIERVGGGGIADPETVKVTFKTSGQAMLTEARNLIFGMGRDISIKKDEDIYADVKQYAIHAKVAAQIEEADAVVWAKNIGLG